MSVDEFAIIRQGWDISEETWHLQRTKGLGGSEVAAITGQSKYTSAIELYSVKIGLVEPEVIDNEAIRWGKRLERPVAEEYAERTGAAVVNWPVMLQSKGYPWMLANLDFVIVEPSDDYFTAGKVVDWFSLEPPPGIQSILEIKTGGIGSHGSTHEWGTEDTPTHPIGYELQVRHYQLVTGILDAKLVALLGGSGLAIRDIPFDPDYAESIIDVESRFWNDNVLPQIPPPPDGSASADEALKSLYPVGNEEDVLEGGSALHLLWIDYLSARDQTKQWTEKRDVLKNQIKALLGNSAYGAVNGQVVASFKNSEPSEFFAEKKFAADNPRLYQQYRMTRPGPRALREVKT